MKKVLALVLAVVMIIGCLAACSKTDTGSSTPTQSQATTTDNSTPADDGNDEPAPSTTGASGPDDTTEHYDMTVYCNYDWWGVKEWGVDEASAFFQEKFNTTVTYTKPDADADAKLRTMMVANNLPDMIVMDRGPMNVEVARGGFLQDLSQYMYDGCSFAEDIPEVTRELLSIDGVLYGIPNWPRNADNREATGGNYQWLVTTSAYEALGSPALNTLDDLHDYAMAAKEAGLTSYSGMSVYPMLTNTSNGYEIYRAFYRALGAPNIVESYYTQEDGKIGFCLDSDTFIEALKIANTWYNDGLFTAEVFTDASDQFLEKLTNGRFALAWYDFSQDDTNNFRRLVREGSNGEDSVEVVGYSPNYNNGELSQYPLFPAANSDVEVVYGDENGSIGWNVNCITTNATNPQRAFDLYTYFLSWEGSAVIMYGPEGGTMMDHMGDDGIPVLKKPQSEFTSDETNAAGAWFWTQPAHSDNIDQMKFAVNEREEAANKNWVVDVQANACTYNKENPSIGQKIFSDENSGLSTMIDTQSQTGVNRQSINDQCAAQLPKIIMAASEDEFNSLIEDLKSYAHSNGVDELCEVFQEVHDNNVELQGYSVYSDEYDVYKVK